MAVPNFADRDGVIWFDGELVPWRDARVHVLTHTLHYGLGCFEGVRAYATPKGTAIFRLKAHTKRLFNSAHILQMAMPWTQAEINEAQRLVVRENGLEEAYLRPMCFLGSEGMGLGPKAYPLTALLPPGPGLPTWIRRPRNEAFAREDRFLHSRHHVNITMCKAKANGNYINSMLALREALDAGAEEALLLDNEGYVAEGSGENIFLVRDGVLHTPELTSCLDGITRNTIFALAADQGLEILERRITRDEVYISDEAFFTGTAAEVLPIRELDGRQIGTGARGPITTALQDAYFEQVRGQRLGHDDWLTLVKD